jgi:hypothetical protein
MLPGYVFDRFPALQVRKSAMTELLSRFAPGEFIALVAVVGAMSCGITAIIMGIRYALRQAEISTALKQDMLDRGMSPDDIRTVVEAGLPLHRKDLVRHYSSKA